MTLTPVVGAIARREGLVARPKSDRWHRRPTALCGGVAIYLAIVPVLVGLGHGDRNLLALLGGSTLLFGVGLVDDLCELKPYQKLAAQVGAAGLLIANGLLLPWTGVVLCDVGLTLLWIVGITNAVNLLDNMDGLAAGIAAIAASCLAAVFVLDGLPSHAVLLVAFAAAMVGFLVYNTNPASIFMGDCGSMFTGFFLAGASLLSVAGGRSRALLPVVAVPVLILLLPIFDMTLVTILRRLAGRPIARGGRDHTSHRLVSLGISERRAVWTLYVLAALSGLMALLVRQWPADRSLAVIAAFSVALSLLGVVLGRFTVQEVPSTGQQGNRPIVALLSELTYKRRVFEVLLDAVLIILSYYVAYTLLFGPLAVTGRWRPFLAAVPVLLVVKPLVFLALGIYRGVWRYVGAKDFVNYGKANLLGSAVSVLLLLLFGCEGVSVAVVVLDGILLLVAMVATRLTFRLFREQAGNAAERRGRRTLIYGAGDAGEILLAELRSNRALACRPVAFLDDDPRKVGTVIYGLRVHEGGDNLAAVLARYRAELVIISTHRLSEARVGQIVAQCIWRDVAVQRLHIGFEELSHAPRALATVATAPLLSMRHDALDQIRS